MTTGLAYSRSEVFLVGRENVGKTTIACALTGVLCRSENFGGSTVSVERYSTPLRDLIDLPGIHRESDIQATRLALEQLRDADEVLLVTTGMRIHEDLQALLPLVAGKSGALLITFRDQLPLSNPSDDWVLRLQNQLGVPVVLVDARRMPADELSRIETALALPGVFQPVDVDSLEIWTKRASASRKTPRPSLFRRRYLGPALAVALLILPALATIFGANALAAFLDPYASWLFAPLIDAFRNANWIPEFLRVPISGDYGLLAMGPFLLVWALPTVVLYALLCSVMKSSGLIEHMNGALDPLVRGLGLSGRDCLRITMGLGCNVPAVIGTRACSDCSRGATVSAIAFGTPCSYQLPATMAVFAAIGKPWLTLYYLGALFVSTLVYLRVTSPPQARSALNILLSDPHTLLQWPRGVTIVHDLRSTVRQFFIAAMPVFALICVVAAYMAYFGVIDWLGGAIAPLMRLFHLPADCAVPVVMASVRKDGVFLFTQMPQLATMSASQMLTATYLAGVLLPCLVTALTVSRELGRPFLVKMLMRQAVAAVLFAAILAWAGAALAW